MHVKGVFDLFRSNHKKLSFSSFSNKNWHFKNTSVEYPDSTHTDQLNTPWIVITELTTHYPPIDPMQSYREGQSVARFVP